MPRLDSTDREILEVLKKAGTVTANLTEISKETGKPITTVRARLLKLEKEGIIKGYAPVVDFKKLGEKIEGFIFIQIRSEDTTQDVAEKILKFKEIADLYIVVGEWVFIAKTRVEDMDKYVEFLDKLASAIKPLRMMDIIAPKRIERVE